MPTVAEVIAGAATRLESVTETPRLDAEILLAHAMKVSRAHLLASLHDEAAPGDFEELLKHRLKAQPIAYILGEWEFYSLAFEIEPPVLVPRPETEHLVEAVLACFSRPFLPHISSRISGMGLYTSCSLVSTYREGDRL